MTDTAALRAPVGHEGPCCGSCYDDAVAYDNGEIDCDHSTYPLCCCRDQRTHEQAESDQAAWYLLPDAEKDYTVLVG